MGELQFISFEEFNNKVQNLDSGVYLITDHNDKVVYVGKAFKIKTRVHAHFNGYSNTKDYAHLFNKVAYILEDSPLKRSLLEITYMIEYKTVLNKEVQEEFPNLYTDYVKNTNIKYKNVKIIPEIDEAFKQAKLEDAVRDIEKGEHRVVTPQMIALQKERARERDRFKKEMFKSVGGKSMFYEILSLLDSGYNPNMLANALSIDINVISLLKERRRDFKIPRNHQRMIKHQDIMYSLSGRRSTSNSRLDHLL